MDRFITRRGHQQPPEQRTAAETLAVSQWEEQKTQSELGKELGQEQIMKNRCYIKGIAETIKFLAVNELSLSGSEDESNNEKAEEEEASPDRLFVALFLYTTKINEELKSAVQSIPANASYTSPDIQNEVISVMGSMVIEEIASLYKTSEVNFFCVKIDETQDSSGIANLSVVVRFVKDGRPDEHLLGLQPLSHLTADYISDLLLQVLTDCGFNPEELIAQYYNGANVMFGRSGEVSKKIQEKLGRTIPYIHGYSHRLHPVLVNACSKIVLVKSFFDTCNALYNFTRKHWMNQLDSVSQLKRLLDHWVTRQLATVRAIINNFKVVLTMLSNLADPEGEAAASTELQVEARGILDTCADVRFVFVALLMKDVLSLFEPGNAALQDKNMPLLKAADVVKACVSVLKERSKADVHFEELLGKMTKICEQNNITVEAAGRGGKRRKKHFKDLATKSSAGTNSDMSLHMCLKQIFIEVHDYSIAEAETTFSDHNMEYFSALDSLVPSSHSFLDIKAVKPLLQLVGGNEDDFAMEAGLVKKNILTPTNPCQKEENSVHNALDVLFSYQNAFPNVYRVLAAAVTLGVSSATCKSSFSCLTCISQPQELPMFHLQKNSLMLLSCEKSLTNSISMDAFIDKFRSQSRRLLL